MKNTVSKTDVKIVVNILLIIVVLIFCSGFFSPIAILIIGYFALFNILKNGQVLDPFIWLISSWLFLFINSFSGIVSFNHNFDIVYPLLYVIFLLITFVLGYFLPTCRKRNVSSRVLDENLINKINNNKSVIKISTLFAYLSISASVLSIIDVFLLTGGDLFNMYYLRQIWNSRTEGTIFGQLASVFYAGGLFSCFFVFILRKTHTLHLISIISFCFGSMITAGRQQLFFAVLTIFIIVCVIKRENLKIEIPKSVKLISIFFVIILLSYMGTLANERNIITDRNKPDIKEFFETDNNCRFSDDFVTLVSLSPSFIQNMIYDGFYYFAHELFGFFDKWNCVNYAYVDFKLLRQFWFLERQIDRIYDFGESQYQRVIITQRTEFNPGIINQTAWRTIIHTTLLSFGLFVTPIIIFFHGFFSKILYNRLLVSPSPYLLLLNIGNILFLINTIMRNQFHETFFFIYIFTSFMLYVYRPIVR